MALQILTAPLVEDIGSMNANFDEMPEYIANLWDVDFQDARHIAPHLDKIDTTLTVPRGLNRLPVGQTRLRVSRLVFEEGGALVIPPVSTSFNKFVLQADETEIRGPSAVYSWGMQGDKGATGRAGGRGRGGREDGERGQAGAVGGQGSQAAELDLDFGLVTYTGTPPSQPLPIDPADAVFAVSTSAGPGGSGGDGGRGGPGEDASCVGSGAGNGGRGGDGGRGGPSTDGNVVRVRMRFSEPVELGYYLFRSLGSRIASGGFWGRGGRGGAGRDCGIWRRGPGRQGPDGSWGPSGEKGQDGPVFLDITGA